MAVVYYPKDQLLYSKDTSQGNYEALVLSSTPNVVLYFGTASVPTSASALDLPITCSWARSASISLTYVTVISASWATQSLSSSYSLNADSASYLLNYQPTVSASYASQSMSSSYSISASYVAGAGTLLPYTLITASSNVITLDFNVPEAFTILTTAAVYSFAAANSPPSGSVTSTTLFISNSVAATSSLSFPSNWWFLGSTPTYITNSRGAMLTLKCYGSQSFVAAFAAQF
jgi:hypothetical protein